MTEKVKKRIRIKFNKEFAKGNQNIEIVNGEIQKIEKDYYWKQQEVYNQVGPLIDWLQSKQEFSEDELYGEFGLVEKLIPLQRQYNAINNRYGELLNRLFVGDVAVEDGSIDVDGLAEDGLAPGKILIYRQGSVPPVISYPDPTILEILDEQRNRVQDEMRKVCIVFAESRGLIIASV